MENEHPFTSNELTRKLKVSLRQLYYWELKGIIKPSLITMGSREFKRYSHNDLDTLKKLKRFLDEGYKLDAAARLVKC